MSKINPILLSVALAGSLASGIWAYKNIASSASSEQVTPVLPLSDTTLHYRQPRKLSDFSLASHAGKTFSKTELQGQWSLVFLGYTSCPDICPTTLQELNFAYPELKSVTDATQVLFVSADPKRDTSDRLSQYIRYFNEQFIALRGEHDQLFPFTRELGLMYSFTDNGNDNYEVSHSGAIVLINPNAEIEAIFKPQHLPGQVPSINPEVLIEDFQKIVEQASLLAKS